MSAGEDEPSSGLNGRLRPRKSNIPSLQPVKITRKLDAKPSTEKPKRFTPSKVTPNKPDDLTEKSDAPSPQILCPYCDKIFYAKQGVSKHIRRIHFSISKQDNSINCLFCNHIEDDGNDIIRHMVDNHPNQYFACYDCHTRFPSTTELAEHKLNACEQQKLPYRNKLRQNPMRKKTKDLNFNGRNDFNADDKNYSPGQSFNRIVISCELKPSHPNDPSDIEDNITTNLILPPSKSSTNATVIEKNAMIVLDDLQWNKRIPSNFSFHNTDADQILSRLGVVHRSPRTGESNRRDWYKNIDETNQKFEKCFDTSFYSKVASNVQENLTKFLDGTFNFSPDPENTIKTRKAKNSVAINTVEGFPILLTCEQFNRNIFDSYMPRAIAPKHKWKWDNLESPKDLISPEQIKRDSHTNNCIITLVSSLDIWTQLCMRQKFEDKFNISTIEKKTEKQTIIGKELKEILESRELPTSSSQIIKYRETPVKARRDSLDFPASLGLVPTKPNHDLKPAVLSGEWVRPRCYVCCACGAQTRDSRGLSSHISNHHPNAQIQHYEIVGEVLLNSDILKHLYVPPSQINNRTRPLRGFRECTKCRQSVTLEDLHQHMLDCAGDTPTVRRKCRYRPFGMRKRRPRLPDNTIRKKIRKDIRSRHNRKNHMRPRPKIRSEVGDAETIRKMLADLPAKRHRVMVNPLNPIMRPRGKLNKQRSKIVMKKRMIEEAKRKVQLGETLHDVDDDHKKPPDQNDHKILKTTVKRVASKILRHKDSFNKKATVRRSRRKGIPNKELKTVNDQHAPSDVEGNMQSQQSSKDYNDSERMNINEDSHNKREHGNTNNGSSNRGNEQSGNNGQSNNSEQGNNNPSKPSQNVPLKHSIARLTACPDTQDRSVQFHRTFLVQQECNDERTQRMPSEERMLFENEAIVTKLDKPPLHFSHQEIMESQMFQRNRLTNKRKGLNDCIAMLRNKLVEPNMPPSQGYSSIQCRSDQPIESEPVIERRHSTTDSNIETAQTSVQMQYPTKTATVDDTPQNYDSARVTRRSQSARREQPQGDKYIDIQANNEFLQWKLYYENQVYAAQQSSEHYTNSRPETTRRRPIVTPEHFLLQHSMSMEMLAAKGLPAHFPEYHYPPPKPMPPQKSTRRSRETRAKSKPKVAKEAPSRDLSLVNVARPRRNTRRGKVETVAAPAPTVNRRSSEKQVEHAQVVSNLITPESMPLVYPQIAMPNNRISVMENQMLITNNYPVEPTYQKTHIYPSAPIIASTSAPIIPSTSAPIIAPTSSTIIIPTSAPMIASTSAPIIVPTNAPIIAPTSASIITSPSAPIIAPTSASIIASTSAPIIYTTNEPDIRQLQYNMPLEPILTTPLDLSHKIPSPSEKEVQYIEEPQYHSAVAYENYETLDLSNRGSNRLQEKQEQISSEEVVDLRVNYSSHQPQPSSYPQMPTESESSRVEHNIHDMSIAQCRSQDEHYPTDLSVKGNYDTLQSYEKRRMHENCSEINVVQDLSHSMMQVQHMCHTGMPSRGLIGEGPTDLSSRSIETHSNTLALCMPEQQPLNLNICTNNTESNREDFPSDLSSRSNERRHRIYVDSQGTEYYEEILVDSERGPIQHVEPQLSINRMDTESMINVHFTSPPRSNCTLSRSIMTYEPQNDVDSGEDITTSNLISPKSARATCALVSCNEMVYRHSEMPLSLAINSVPEPRAGSSLQCDTAAASGYDHRQLAYTMTNVAQYNPVETPNMNIDVDGNNPATPLTIDVVNIESVEPPPCNLSPVMNESCDNDIIVQDEEYVYNSDKPLPFRESPVPCTEQPLECGKRLVEGAKEDSSKLTSMDQDPETARKIAMLPKELVEILGTMPVDHRNQLLNVLPQYVSTSTSPVSPNNKPDDKTNSSCSPNNKSCPELKTVVKKDQVIEITTDDRCSSFNNKMATSPTTVSSSILLTPPTPQLSERHLNQLQESTELISSKYQTNSRRSAEDRPLRNIDPDNTKMLSDLSSINTVSKMDEIDTKERIIDLTIDECSTEESELYYNPDHVISSIPLPPTPKPSAQKSNNDKTASLRAVRIKAPSERHRSVLSENISFKNLSENMLNKPDEELKIRSSDDTNPMAIQQAEISSTQHRTHVVTPPVSSSADPPIKDDNFSSKEHKENNTKEKSDIDNKHTSEKQNIVTSTFTKDPSCDSKNISIVTKAISPKCSIDLVDVSSSKKTDIDTNIPTECTDTIKVNVANTHVSDKNNQDNILNEDEDSEDDVTLASIVKKKIQEYSKFSEDNHININKKKRKSKKSKKTAQIITETSLCQVENQPKLKYSKSLADETNASTDPLEFGSKNKDVEITEDSNREKEVVSKKKNKKIRRTNKLSTAKFIKEQNQLYQSIAQNEVDKENTVSSDVVNNVEAIEEPIKSKSPEIDTNEPIVSNKHAISDKDKSIKKINIRLEHSNDYNLSRNTAKDKNSESTNANDSEEDLDRGVSSSSKISVVAPNITCNSSVAVYKEMYILDNEQKVSKSEQKLNINKLNDDSIVKKIINVTHINVQEITDKFTEVLTRSAEPIVSKIVTLKDTPKSVTCEEIPKNVTTKEIPKIVTIKENKQIPIDISIAKREDNTAKEDSNTTPLRRSRRGKSLFIDSTTNDGTHIENIIEHKAPLTKKQLIFSKLLLDEENHNKTVKGGDEEKLTELNSLVTQNNIVLISDSEIDKELTNEHKTTNKRKKSLHIKRKCKKKKSFENIESLDDTDLHISAKTSTESSKELSPTVPAGIIVLTPIMSNQNLDHEDEKNTKFDNNDTKSAHRIETFYPVQKPASSEKRKSSSPVKFDSLLPSLKPKKSKPNEEVSSTQPSTLTEKVTVSLEKVTLENKGGVTAVVVSRNTTCYDKPAAKRVRSKSVVVKSSGADLYDPYDIDLEDMAEKTEPFIRREISSNIEFNSFKSSIIAKTRKLTQTAPSAIIDISPTEHTDGALSTTNFVEKNNVSKDNVSSTDYVDISVSRTKDSSSDSDESSKSDVPLKKYIEEKERKLLKEESTKVKRLQESVNCTIDDTNEEKTICDKLKPRKKNKRALSTHNKDAKQSKEGTEEELRSEQFMESFGFFSERKPRKSNLLATKKISETFHIIANESDDVYLPSREKHSKKISDSKKEEEMKPPTSMVKKSAKRGRKKKIEPPQPAFCNICKKAFRRFDNYSRHQMSLIHISRLAEVELKVKTMQIEEEPNYLLVYKRQLDRLKILQNKIAKRKKNCISTADIILPTLEEILADVKRTIREQQLSRRGLSRDQALFIDCCEMLKESHKNDHQLPTKRKCNSFNCAAACQEELMLLERSISDDKCDIKCLDVDPITAKNILESEEVRNLENDLISNLKEANGLKGPLINVRLKSSDTYNSVDEETINQTKSKRQIEVKEKMYPDVVENIDMFEDKFDKIKRKCRSQAAAAKTIQSQTESNVSYKISKKSDKKRGRKNSKKCLGTVPTKGALKGFDGIKVSILTSDINISAIVPSLSNSFKKEKEKKSSSKKKRERKSSDGSSKSDSSDQRSSKETPQKKVDVYEFMDTEDTELFEFRPSTLMERFKSISNKEIPSTSKTVIGQIDAADVSSDSASDGDDFVYMSDDYVCSDDETENSMVSCELGVGLKKSAYPLKKKDVTEKNAVMGKIFKHNAVRSDRISPKRRETSKPKANLDQLFDSLLQEEPKPPSLGKDDEELPKEKEKDATPPQSLSPSSHKHDVMKPKHNSTSKDYNTTLDSNTIISENTPSNELPNDLNTSSSAPSSNKRKSITPPRKLDLNLIENTIEYELLAPNRKDQPKKSEPGTERRHSSHHPDMFTRKYDSYQPDDEDEHSADEDDNASQQSDDYRKNKSKEKWYKEREKNWERDNEKERERERERKRGQERERDREEERGQEREREGEKSYVSKKEVEPTSEEIEDAGVARQRARRKCTVGKQNVLAETWSSESEPDGTSHRPACAEPSPATRRKKGRRREPPRSRPPRPRPRADYYWSDGDDDHDHPPQHGWIVGDSHKKLVTMLAHAKNRRRPDDKRTLLE